MWRLYRDSLTATAGYYWFAPEGTPHLPALHNYGSADWTTDDRRDEATTRGEVYPPLDPFDRNWSAGGRPGQLPLPVLTCQPGEYGDQSIADATDELLYLGVPLRCYSVAPTLPACSPWAWHRPDGFDTFTDGTELFIWPDSSPAGRDLRWTSPATRPLVFQGGDGGLPWVRFRLFDALNWYEDNHNLTVYSVGDKLTVYLKGHTSATPGFLKVWGPKMSWVTPGTGDGPAYQNVTSFWRNKVGTANHAQNQLVDQSVLLFFRLDGTALTAGIVGQQVYTATVGASAYEPIGITMTRVAGDAARRECFISETLVYDRYLSDEEHEVNLAYFAARYP